MAVGCNGGDSSVLAVGNEEMRELFLDSSKLLPHGCNLKGSVTSYSCHGPGFIQLIGLLVTAYSNHRRSQLIKLYTRSYEFLLKVSIKTYTQDHQNKLE